MTPDEILALVRDLRELGVSRFQCEAFTVEMVPLVTTSVPVEASNLTFDEDEVKAEPGEGWRGFSNADLGLD